MRQLAYIHQRTISDAEHFQESSPVHLNSYLPRIRFSSQIDMPDFESLDALEAGFARLSGIAFKTAHNQALAAGGSVAVLENGAVYEVFPDGRRVFIHAVKEPVRVQVGARYVRRDARPK